MKPAPPRCPRFSEIAVRYLAKPLSCFCEIRKRQSFLDDTPIYQVNFPRRILNAFSYAGLKTVGDVRDAPESMLLSFPDMGPKSVAHLRETLGLPSSDGVRPVGPKTKGI